MSLLDTLSHYPNSSDQRVAWYRTLTAALNEQNVNELQFDNIQPCGSGEEQLAALQCCATALQHAQYTTHKFDITVRILQQATRYCRDAVPYKSDVVQTALIALCAASTRSAMQCMRDTPQQERTLTKHIMELMMPLIEQQWLTQVQSVHYADLIALCECAVALSNKNVGTSAVMNVTWKMIRWCLKETGRCFVQHNAHHVIDTLQQSLTQLLLNGYKRYVLLRSAGSDTEPKLLLAVDKSLKFLFPCLVAVANNYPDLLMTYLDPIAEFTQLVVSSATASDSTRQYCYKGLVTIFRHLFKSAHLTATQHEHVIKHVIAGQTPLVLDLLPELASRVTALSTDWPAQVLTCVIAQVSNTDPHTVDFGEISASPTPSPNPTPSRAETPVIQQSLHFLTHALASVSPAECHVIRELVVSHVLDVNWHVSQLALQWWCLLLDTHRDHCEIYMQVLVALIERYRQWTRSDTCQTETLVTSLFETRVSTLLLHSLMHVTPAQQQRLVQVMDAPLRAHLSMTPLGLTLVSLTAPHTSLSQLTRTVQQSLAEFTHTAPARLLDPLALLVNAMSTTSDNHELTALLTRLFDWYCTLTPSDTCHYSTTLARLLTYMAIRLRIFNSPLLSQVLTRMTQVVTAGHRGVLYFSPFVALCLQQTTVPVVQCAALIAALLDARHDWPIRLATMIALADVASLMPAPELLEQLIAADQLTDLLTFLDHATPSSVDVSARLTGVTALLAELHQSLVSRVVTGASESDPDSALIHTTLSHLDAVLFDLRKMTQQWPHESALVSSVRSVERALNELERNLKQGIRE